jgi:hypothetical protein
MRIPSLFARAPLTFDPEFMGKFGFGCTHEAPENVRLMAVLACAKIGRTCKDRWTKRIKHVQEEFVNHRNEIFWA